MSKSDVVMLLAGARTGTNLFRSLLGSHSEIDGNPGEVFDDNAAAHVEFPTFYSFLRDAVVTNRNLLLPNNRFAALDIYFSDLMRRSPKPRILVDVKYNSMHHFGEFWEEPSASPVDPRSLATLRYAQGRLIPIIHLLRKDTFSEIMSAMIAERTGIFHNWSGDPAAVPKAGPVVIKTEGLINRMRHRDAIKSLVASLLRGMRNTLTIYYEDILDADGMLSGDTARRVADFLGIDAGGFNRNPITSKVVKDWKASVSNADEVSAAVAAMEKAK